MDVFGIYIPDKSLTNFELIDYATQLKIPNFRGVFMRDTLPKIPHHRVESGIVNFNTSDEKGSHWTCYYKNRNKRIYFDSYGQITPIEVQNYLKKRNEYGLGVILRNTDIVQAPGTTLCGHLCLFVLKALNSHWTFQEVLTHLNDGYSQGNR